MADVAGSSELELAASVVLAASASATATRPAAAAVVYETASVDAAPPVAPEVVYKTASVHEAPRDAVAPVAAAVVSLAGCCFFFTKHKANLQIIHASRA